MAITRDQMREYLRLWHGNRAWLDSIRDEEIRRADTAQSIRAFEQAFRIALRDLPPRSTSGLLEWQDAMARWRSRG